MPGFGNANTLTYNPEQARRDPWVTKNRVLPLALPPAGTLTTTRLLREQSWPGLTVQLLEEPACVTPALLPPPTSIRLILNLSGSLRLAYSSGGKRSVHDTTCGTVKLTTPHGQPYEMQWVPLTPEPVRTAHVYLAPELLARTAEAAGLHTTRVELREGSGLHDPLLHAVSLALALAHAPATGLDHLYADTAAQLLAVHLLRRYGVFAPPPPNHRGQLPAPRLRAVRDYVRAHLSENIRLEELAALAFLSPYHFCRVFKRTTGLTPQQFVIRQRMERAVELLGRPGLSGKEVSAAVGYASYSHFAQLFLRHTNQLPVNFLKRNRH